MGNIPTHETRAVGTNNDNEFAKEIGELVYSCREVGETVEEVVNIGLLSIMGRRPCMRYESDAERRRILEGLEEAGAPEAPDQGEVVSWFSLLKQWEKEDPSRFREEREEGVAVWEVGEEFSRLADGELMVEGLQFLEIEPSWLGEFKESLERFDRKIRPIFEGLQYLVGETTVWLPPEAEPRWWSHTT